MLTQNLQVTDSDAARTLTRRRKGWKKFVLYNSPAFSWLIAIFFITALPSSNFGESQLFSGDKVIHALIFFILVTLQMQALIKQQLFPKLRYEAGYYALLYGFVISGLTEIMQGLLLNSRSADPYDYIANTVGCVAGWVFFTYFVLQKQ